MFDVGDLPVLTFGNCVLKAEWGCETIHMYVYVSKSFFFKIQKHDYVFWVVAHVFSNTGSMAVCVELM